MPENQKFKDEEKKNHDITEDEMVGWHHSHNEHGFEQTPGNGEG